MDCPRSGDAKTLEASYDVGSPVKQRGGWYVAKQSSHDALAETEYGVHAGG
eukprot:m.115579 g.115579  ORF g.115579 m.115579 type:complete len:51 (-) comp13575_c0_seq3:236-388(-)